MSKKTNKIFQESTTIKDGKGHHSLAWITDFNEGGKSRYCQNDHRARDPPKKNMVAVIKSDTEAI